MTETFNYKNDILKIKNGEDFSLNELKSRLHRMEIPFNENEKKKKSHYCQLYNQAIKNNNNKMKIINILINDSVENSDNPNLKRQLIKEENNSSYIQKFPKLNDDSYKNDFNYNQETSQKNPNSNNFTNTMNYNYNYNNNNNMYNNNFQNKINPQRNISNNDFNKNFNYHNINRMGINNNNNNYQNGNEGNKINIKQNINNQFHNQSPNKKNKFATDIEIGKNYENNNIKNNTNFNTQYPKYTNNPNNPNQNYYKTNNISYDTPIQTINEKQNIYNNFNQNNLNQTINKFNNNHNDYNRFGNTYLINQNELPNNQLSFKNSTDINKSSSIIDQDLNYQNKNNNDINYSNEYTTKLYNTMNNINQQTNMDLHNSTNMNDQYNNQNDNQNDNYDEINTSSKLQNIDSIQNNKVSILDTQNNNFNNNNNLPEQFTYNNYNYNNNEPNEPFFNKERLSNIYTLLSLILTMGMLGLFIYLISKYNLTIINFTKNGLNTITNPKKFFGEFLLGNLLSLLNILKQFVWKYLYQILFIELCIIILFFIKKRRDENIMLNEIFEDIKRRLNEIFHSNNEYSMIGGIPEKDIIKIYSDKYNISYDVFNKNYMPYLRDMRRNNINIKIKEMNYKGENQLIWYWHE